MDINNVGVVNTYPANILDVLSGNKNPSCFGSPKACISTFGILESKSNSLELKCVYSSINIIVFFPGVLYNSLKLVFSAYLCASSGLFSGAFKESLPLSVNNRLNNSSFNLLLSSIF